MELAQRSLCKSNVNYQYLLNTLILITNIIQGDPDGTIIMTDPSVIIIIKLFYGIVTPTLVHGIWYDQTVNPIVSSFIDLDIYYHNKNCEYGSEIWQPIMNNTISNSLVIVGAPNAKTFKEITDAFAFWLGNINDSYELEIVLQIIESFSEVLNQRIEIDRILFKTVVLLNDLEF